MAYDLGSERAESQHELSLVENMQITAVTGQTMSDNYQTQTKTNEVMIYQIRLQGHLGRQWTAWFEGMRITLEDNGDTLITGPVADQSALHGLLKKVRDLGMPLLSVISIESDQTDESDIKHIQGDQHE